MKEFDWKNRTKFRGKYINPLIELNLITMTIPVSLKVQNKNILPQKKVKSFWKN